MEKSNIMRLSKITLGALLVLQLAITLNLYWSNQQQRKTMSTAQALFDVDPAQIDKVVVNDGATSVTLQKAAEGWQVAELSNLPANGLQVDALVNTITALQPSWPVATTASSQQQLEVAADNFQRQVKLYAGDQEIGELLLGTSPGFKQTHARRGDSESIFSVALSNHELPARDSAWLDKRLLSASAISAIQGADFAVEKQQDGPWQFAATAEQDAAQGELDADKAAQLAAALANLSVLEVAEQPAEGTVTELAVAGADGNWRYRFTEAGDQYYVSRDDRDAVFTVSKFDYERIAAIDRPQLAVQQPEPTEASAATEEGAAPTEATAATGPSTGTSEPSAGAADTAEPLDQGDEVDAPQDSEAANS